MAATSCLEAFAFQTALRIARALRRRRCSSQARVSARSPLGSSAPGVQYRSSLPFRAQRG
eukprot:15012079-Alexandrium_andersonii.AAC.1